MKFDNYECDGQISLSDYQIVTNNGWNIFHEHCTHRGWNKAPTDEDPGGWQCGKGATCWADWFPCTEGNCPLLRKD